MGCWDAGGRGRIASRYSKGVAHPTRFERVTFAFGGQRSIQLSYGCVEVHLADWPGIGNGRATTLQALARVKDAGLRLYFRIWTAMIA